MEETRNSKQSKRPTSNLKNHAAVLSEEDLTLYLKRQMPPLDFEDDLTNTGISAGDFALE